MENCFKQSAHFFLEPSIYMMNKPKDEKSQGQTDLGMNRRQRSFVSMRK